MDRAYRIHQFLIQAVLHQIAACASLQRTQYLDIAHVGREYDNFRVREFTPNGGDCIEAAHLRHLQIHQGHIGPMSPESLQRLAPIRSLGHQAHVRLRVEKRGNSLADNMMVVYDENSYGIRFIIHDWVGSRGRKPFMKEPTPLRSHSDVHPGSGNRQVNFGSRGRGSPDGQLAAQQVGTLAHAVYPEMPLRNRILQKLRIDTFTVVTYPHPHSRAS